MTSVRARLERLIGSEYVDSFTRSGWPQDIAIAAPNDHEQLAELLRFAHGDGLKLVPVGLASKLGWCAPPERVDFVLSTRRLTGVIENDPGEGTLTARAGSTIAALSDAARAGGHHLTPDVATPARATLGGTIAAAASGLDRMRYGPVREHVLGVRAVLADGSITKCGGRLVKNVTGFDLHRLYCGSHGTLCVIVEATLRLFPGPESEIAISAEFEDAPAALAQARTLALDRSLQPAALLIENHAGPLDAQTDQPLAAHTWRLHVLLAGRSEIVEDQHARVLAVLENAISLRDRAARAHCSSLRDLECAGETWPDVRVTCRPSRLLQALTSIEEFARDAPQRASFSIQPALAIADVRLRADSGGSADGERRRAERALEIARRARAAGLQALVRNEHANVSRAFDPFGDPAPGLELMRRVKHNLDPNGVFAAGRTHGGL